MFPEYSYIKTAVKALLAKAIIEDKRGHHAQAWALLKQGSVLAKHTGSDPCLISALVECACDAVVERGCERLLLAQNGSSEAVAGAREVMAALGPVPDLHRGFEGELVLGRIAIKIFRGTRDLKALIGSDTAIPLSRNPLAYTSTAFDSYDARLIEAYRRLTLALPKGYDHWQAASSAISEISRQECPENRPSYFFNLVFLPVFNQSVEAMAMDETRRHICLTACNLFEYRNAHGAFPAAVSPAADSIDTMDGKPLRYQLRGASFLLYSVSHDLKDDGGKSAREVKNGNPFDEVFGSNAAP